MKKCHWTILPVIVSLIFVLSACNSGWQLVNNNLAAIYVFDDAFAQTQMNVCHENDSLSFVRIDLPQTPLLFSRVSPNDSFRCRVNIKIIAVSSDNHGIKDSSSFSFLILKDSLATPEITLSLPLKLKRNFTGMVFALLQAPPMKHEKILVAEVNKSNPASLQWFKYNTATGTLDISRYDFSQSGYSLKIFRDTSILPPPPFSMENYREQQRILGRTVPLNSSGNTIEFRSGETYWQIQGDSGAKSDYVYISSGNHPYVRSAREMLQPMRYLTSQKEYQKIEKDSSMQRAIEKFWIEVAGTQERARRVISDYYKGVEIANRLFSDYRPGWKTDRGMIYVVMGAPRIMYRGTDREIWIYGEERSLYSVTFEFEKINNIYILQRNPGSKENWYQAVEMWRQ